VALFERLDHAAAEQQLGFVDEGAVSREGDAFRLHDGAVLATLLHVKHDACWAGRRSDEVAEFDERSFAHAIERDADADVVRQANFHVFERLNRRNGQLGRSIFFCAERAADEDGDFNLERFGKTLVVARETDDFNFSRGVFERALRVELAGAFGLGDLEADDDAGDGDFVFGRLAAAPASRRFASTRRRRCSR